MTIFASDFQEAMVTTGMTMYVYPLGDIVGEAQWQTIKQAYLKTGVPL